MNIASHNSPEKNKPRILFVDDDLKILNALRRILHPETCKWDMTFMASPKQALNLAAKKHFDLVVSDFSMPDINGTELISMILQLHPNTPCLLLTGQDDKPLSTTIPCITKPCGSETLCRKLTAVLNQRKSKQEK